MQEIVRQVNFNIGEIDPRTDARSDLKVYYAALELAENLVTTPVGPIVRRPGTVFIDKARHVLEAVPVEAGNVFIGGLGGTAADLVAADGVLFTTTAIGIGPATLFILDLGAPTEVALIDLMDYAMVEPAAPAGPAPPPFVYPYEPPGGFGGIGGFGELP